MIIKKYLCPHCAREHGEDDLGSWFTEIDLPLHLNLVHDHRVRDMKDILKDWSCLGMVTVKEENTDSVRVL